MKKKTLEKNRISEVLSQFSKMKKCFLTESFSNKVEKSTKNDPLTQCIKSSQCQNEKRKVKKNL